MRNATGWSLTKLGVKRLEDRSVFEGWCVMDFIGEKKGYYDWRWKTFSHDRQFVERYGHVWSVASREMPRSGEGGGGGSTSTSMEDFFERCVNLRATLTIRWPKMGQWTLIYPLANGRGIPTRFVCKHSTEEKCSRVLTFLWFLPSPLSSAWMLKNIVIIF